jgi:DEAD/DEAH box helicase/Helicase conserved C-terminal domain
MFDAPTAQLIASAPALDGLDLTSLPKDLTKAYSTIVSLRMRLRHANADSPSAGEIEDILGRLERLGYAQEAFAAIAPDRANRASAAYVAATAHQLRFSAQRLQDPKERTTQITLAAIGPEIAATIMFLIADRVADAAQMSRSIRFEGSETIEEQLRRAIVDLAQGNLNGIRSNTWHPPEAEVFHVDLSAVALLWWRLLQGLRILAGDLLGLGDAPILEGRSASVFAEVRDLSVQVVEFGGDSQVMSVFPGPHHMASLLYCADGVLRKAAVVGLQNPPEIDSPGWSKFLASLARRRPYLWPNHQEAIGSGYLTPGISTVMSFPTGAGKSTLTELKIAVTKQSGKKVAYLAPTLALVSQVAADLRKTFPEARGASGDEMSEEDLSSVAVMTPERCLTLLGFNPEGFGEVGLLVFDECHIIHPQAGSSRRSVDAMLCLLGFLRASPSADVLLVSAMVKNAKELAEWLTSLLGREVLALPSNWKPTRQARGCVVYDGVRVNQLKQLIAQDASTKTTASISAPTKRQLTARPLGMFSLHQTWTSTTMEDYALLPLLDTEVHLDAKKVSQTLAYLTSNRNAVAAEITARSGDQGVKTLVFAQTIPFCSSIQKKVTDTMSRPKAKLNSAERRQRDFAVAELGGEEFTYCELEGRVASHHGLLLPSERSVNESLFRRPDGVSVLVATSTLAQGMNLPSQLVVIAGDDKYDVELEKPQMLEAHNLLNAAGRAGRAGEAAEGMVILIPGKVVEFHENQHSLSGRWFELQAIFSNSDQCLDLEDPIEPLLDQIHNGAEDANLSDYLIRRLPIKIGEGEELARALLEKSFGAFRHRRAGDVDWIEQRIHAALARRRSIIAEPSSFGWEDELASTTGVLSSSCIKAIAEEIRKSLKDPSGHPTTWIRWGLDWLLANPSIVTDIVRPLTITGVFGKEFDGIETDEAKPKALLKLIAKALPLWIGGAALRDIEQILKPHRPSPKCDTAREWALRFAPELAYFFSLVTQIYKKVRQSEGELEVVLPLGFAMHGRCVREGFDLVEKLALFQAENGSVPRVAIHQRWATGGTTGITADEYESFSGLVRRVKRAFSA